MPTRININGVITAAADAKISVLDHGFLYGDGVFEGIRVYNGRVSRLEEHLDRLWQGAHTLMLKIPMSRNELRDALFNTLRTNGLKDTYVRLVVTRGVGDLGSGRCARAP